MVVGNIALSPGVLPILPIRALFALTTKHIGDVTFVFPWGITTHNGSNFIRINNKLPMERKVGIGITTDSM